jgi:hypothetical protein
MRIRSERWLIKPLTCPRPIRYCPACGAVREFVCSERFRVNAHKKNIDVWLLYRCSDCDDTWKYPVHERQSIAAFDSAAYECYVRHAQRMVWKHACDLGRMRSHAVCIATSAEIAVERSILSGPQDAAALCIHLEVPIACDHRLDRLLATELGVSRATIQQWYEQDKLQFSPQQGSGLNKRIRDGQRLQLRVVASGSDGDGA